MNSEPEKFTISIKNIELHIPLGWYDEEQILGNKVIISCSFKILKSQEKDLNQWVDYSLVLSAITAVAKQPHRLMEQLSEEILHVIFSKFQLITDIELEICKMHPTLDAKTEQVCIKNIQSRG